MLIIVPMLLPANNQNFDVQKTHIFSETCTVSLKYRFRLQIRFEKHRFHCSEHEFALHWFAVQFIDTMSIDNHNQISSGDLFWLLSLSEHGIFMKQYLFVGTVH